MARRKRRDEPDDLWAGNRVTLVLVVVLLVIGLAVVLVVEPGSR